MIAQRDPSNQYSYTSIKYWCHQCRREFSQLKTSETQDVLCPRCGGISEEIDPNNHPRNFYEYEAQMPYEHTSARTENLNAQRAGNQSNQSQRNPNPMGNPSRGFSQGFTSVSYSTPIGSFTIIQSEDRGPSEDARVPNYDQRETQIDPLSLLLTNPFLAVDTWRPRLFRGFLHEGFADMFGGEVGFGTHPLFNFMSPERYQQLVEEFLRNDPNRHGPPPASRSTIDKLPQIKVTEQNCRTFDVCSVCQDDFKPGQNCVRLPCEHFYHSDCVVTWLNLHNTCPICRKPVE